MLERIIDRALDILERWLPRWMVQVCLGVFLWAGAVLSWVEIAPLWAGGAVAALLAAAGWLPLHLGIKEGARQYRANKCPVGSEWDSLEHSIDWILEDSGLFSSGALNVPAARNLARGYVHGLTTDYPKAVGKNEGINRDALRWYIGKKVAKGGKVGRIRGGVVVWETRDPDRRRKAIT